MGRLSTFIASRSGSAGVELALVLPFVLVLILVTLEGAHYLYMEHKVAKGVRDGARYAARLAFSNYDCASNSIDPDALSRIRNITRTGFPDADNPAFSGTDNPVIGGWTGGDVAVTVDCVSGQDGLYTAVSGMAPIVKVNAIVTYPRLFAIPGLDPSSIRLRSQAQAAVMGI